jgi:hypothetical protein
LSGREVGGVVLVLDRCVAALQRRTKTPAHTQAFKWPP